MDFRLQIDMPNFGGQNMQKKYNSQLVPFARQLRSEMTKEERHLWYDFLRTYPIRFSRQKVLGKYIADFYSGTYACTARFGVGVDAHIDPADCTVFTVICGEFATSRRADVGIGPYRVLREFTAAHRADRGVRPCASLGNPTQNRKTIVFDRLRFPQPLCGLWEFFFLCVALTVSTIPRGKRKSISRLLTFPVPRATL